MQLGVTALTRSDDAPLVRVSKPWRRPASAPPFAAFHAETADCWTTISFKLGRPVRSRRSLILTCSARRTPSKTRARSLIATWSSRASLGTVSSSERRTRRVTQAVPWILPTTRAQAAAFRRGPLEISTRSLRMTAVRGTAGRKFFCGAKGAAEKMENRTCFGVISVVFHGIFMFFGAFSTKFFSAPQAPRKFFGLPPLPPLRGPKSYPPGVPKIGLPGGAKIFRPPPAADPRGQVCL